MRVRPRPACGRTLTQVPTMTGITDPNDEYFKDGLWGWDNTAKVWIKVRASSGKLQVETVPELHHTTHENGGSDEVSVAGLSGELADDQPPKAHDLGGAKHNADTLANLNAKISDATLDDSGDARTPSAHKTSHAGGGTDKLKYTRQILWFLPDAALATGNDKSATIVYRGPTLTLVRWDFYAKTAPTGAAMIVDVNVAGTSLWDTTQANRPTIAAAATSGTGTSFDTTSLADGDVLTLDVDQVGSTIAGGQITLILDGEANPETD